MIVRIACTEPSCANGVKVDTDKAKVWLKANGRYGFGDHVTDERAFAMRLAMLGRRGYPVGTLGKSTVAMPCNKHREPALELLEESEPYNRCERCNSVLVDGRCPNATPQAIDD